MTLSSITKSVYFHVVLRLFIFSQMILVEKSSSIIFIILIFISLISDFINAFIDNLINDLIDLDIDVNFDVNALNKLNETKYCTSSLLIN